MGCTFAYDGAYGVEVTSKYVHVDGAKCSCSLSTGYYGYYNNISFLNYCPNCHRSGCLHYEVGSASWTSPEGLWYCGCCDMDYCCVHGKSHDNRGRYLSRYVIPPPEPVVQQQPEPSHIVVTGDDGTQLTLHREVVSALNKEVIFGLV